MDFSAALRAIRRKSGKSRYRLAQYSGLTEAYVFRLESGERAGPSRDVVIMLGLALAHGVSPVEAWDVDALLLSAGHAPLRRRGEPAIRDDRGDHSRGGLAGQG